MGEPCRKVQHGLAEASDGMLSKIYRKDSRYVYPTPSLSLLILAGSFIERKRCALTWHYRRADPELGAHNAHECQKELEQTVGKEWDVEVMTGKANLEVRPTFINKGEIVKRLVASYGAEKGQAPEFLLCLGDDFTD